MTLRALRSELAAARRAYKRPPYGGKARAAQRLVRARTALMEAENALDDSNRRKARKGRR